MTSQLLTAAYRRLGRRYPPLLLAAQLVVSHFVVALAILELPLFQRMSAGQFGRAMAVGQGLLLVENVMLTKLHHRMLRPVSRWLRGERSPERTLDAWRALVRMPGVSVRRSRVASLFLTIVPFSAYVTAELHLPFYAFFVLVAGGITILIYGLTVRFFLMETALRPVLVDVAQALPENVELGRVGVSLRTKLLATLPLINFITGVTVSGLSAPGHPSLSRLGVTVVVALGVSYTLSFVLSLLLVRSILMPIGELRRAADQIRQGDFSARVPVLATDETGAMAQSFNDMAAGLEERRRLHEAFGAFVDPEVADMVLRDGVDLAGEEVEVTVLFLDIRNFTAFAENASAAEVVQELNRFYELVVPMILRHGGHANKFIGDGLLAVFGAPDRLPDHADRALAAALEIVRAVRARYGPRHIGIGINSGPVAAGTIGGGGRVEFTVIGDAVNTAARVEEITRQTGDEILLTEATRCLLERPPAHLEEREPVPLKGKRETVRLWAATEALPDTARRSVAAHRSA